MTPAFPAAAAETPVSTLSPFTASDGENIAVQDWPLPPGVPQLGQALLVHGLGEHVGRYAHVAQALHGCGLAVRGYDQYGHGESAGPRGGLSSDTRLLDDLADIVDATRARMAPGQPLLLVGHSMGGLVAARFVSLGLRPVDGLVLSSPAFDAGLSAVQKLLVSTLPRLLPDLRVGNGLNTDYLSHDAAVARAYLADPLCHDRISGRLGRFIAEAGPATVACAPHWSVPTLLLWAGQDRLVNPAGSAQFAASAPPAVVQSHCFETLYHELFNEADARPVFMRLQAWVRAWLDTQPAARAASRPARSARRTGTTG